MKPQFPTVQEQINYWNKKEGEELDRVSRIQEESLDKRDESRDATNETRRAYIGPAMFQYAKDYSQELMPQSLLDELEEFIDGFVDGSPDADHTSKTANHLKAEIVVHRNKVFFH